MKKAVIITNIPTPYRIPLFNEIDEQLEQRGIKLTIVFGAAGYERRRWELDMSECRFEHRVLPSRRIRLGDAEKVSFTYSGLGRALAEIGPDVVVGNGFSPATTRLWLRSWLGGTRYIIWSGAIAEPGLEDSLLRRAQRRLLVGRASGFIAYGKKASDYLVSLGADPGRIEIGLNTVDTEFFRTESERARGENPPEGGPPRLLYIGDLVRRKRPDLLLPLLKLVLKSRPDAVLELVGDGAEREGLERRAAELGVSARVRLEGHRQRKDIPGYLAGASCFLFPTDFDVWGLVLVEAMAAGCVCVSSIHAGATPDLIEDGVTGFAMDFNRSEEVAERTNWIIDHPEESKRIGENARRFISERASLEVSAAGFVRAIEAVLSSP